MQQIDVIHPKRLFAAHSLFGNNVQTIYQGNKRGIGALDVIVKNDHLSDKSFHFDLKDHFFIPEHPLELPARPSSLLTSPDLDNIKDPPSFPDYIPLVTYRIGFLYDRREDATLPPPHTVVGLLGDPQVLLGVGMKVDTGEIVGRLTKVFGLVDGGVRFALEQDDLNFPFALLQVEYEYAKLPPLWKMKLLSRRGWQGIKKWCRKL
jgi:hypothetical protein